MLNLTIRKTSGKITYGDIHMKLANLGAFEVKSAGGSVLDLTKPVYEILGKNATDEISNVPHIFKIKVKATLLDLDFCCLLIKSRINKLKQVYSKSQI